MNQSRSMLYLLIVFSCVLIPTVGKADMSRNAVASKMMMAKKFETPISEVTKYFSDITFKRALTEDEKNIQTFLTLAVAMNVVKITATTKDIQHFQIRMITDSILEKMRENPKWDVALTPQNLKLFQDHSPLLKKTFTEKSYAWSWFNKQDGQIQVAKKILNDLFKDGISKGMTQTYRGFGYTDPVSELGLIYSALEPMSSTAEKRELADKLQKLKTFYSNLPDSNIMT